MGNYLLPCVYKALKVSKQHLSRQRKVKRKLFQQQETNMLKEEVEKERLVSFVVMPESFVFLCGGKAFQVIMKL